MAKKTKSYWAQQAAEAIKAGYSPGNIYENRLKRNLEQIKPEMFQELQKANDLDNYAITQVASAFDLAESLRNNGMDPFLARQAMESQLSDLLRTKEDEAEEQPIADSWTQQS